MSNYAIINCYDIFYDHNFQEYKLSQTMTDMNGNYKYSNKNDSCDILGRMGYALNSI